MKYYVAIFETDYSTRITMHSTSKEGTESHWAYDRNYTRVSEWQEVEFVDREYRDIQKDKLDSINEKIQLTQAEYELRISDLKGERQKLMALDHQVSTHSPTDEI